jgi:hypothetical protein
MAKTRVLPSESLAVDPSTVTADGKLNMRNAGEIRTQVEHRCCCGEVVAELTTVAVTGSHVGNLTA